MKVDETQRKKRSNGRGDDSTEGLRWFFPRNDFGQDSGFHDPGVETFKGNIYRLISRELIQNSLDARAEDASGPVVVSFESLEVARDSIPDLDSLQDALARCATYWAKDGKAKTFFERAVRKARHPTIEILRVRDFNTTGVLGDDKDRDKDWYNLIRCSGSSSKSASAAGAFGIGKNAPIAASFLRTVLYSTNTGGNKYAFQGVAKLATHELKGGGKAHQVGYLGGPEGQSVRKLREIPEWLRREDRGTDLIIVGWMFADDWDKELILGVLEGFWPAVFFGELEVVIGELRITKASLYGLMKYFGDEEGFNAPQYYDAFISPTKSTKATLQNLGKVSLHLKTGEMKLSKKIALVRKSGMVIDHRLFQSPVPFCGVFFCRSEPGNSRLRDMEPPRHDKWDPDLPERGASKAIHAELTTFLRGCVSNLTSRDNVKIIEMPEFSRFLPDDDSPEEPLGSRDVGDTTRQEGIPPKPPEPQKRTQIPPNKQAKKKPEVSDSEGEQAEGSEEGGEGQSVGGGIGGTGGRGGSGGSGAGGSGGAGSDGTAGEPAGGSGPHAKPAIPIKYRAYPTSDAAREYRITVRPERANPLDATLTLQAVGDDAKEPIRIKGARVVGGADIPFEVYGKVGPVALSSTAPLRLEITLEEPRKMSMEVSANET
ncbi:MAG: hypothetical protein ACLQU5_08760 [Isosphaeraceae bacterium]